MTKKDFLLSSSSSYIIITVVAPRSSRGLTASARSLSRSWFERCHPKAALYQSEAAERTGTVESAR